MTPLGDEHTEEGPLFSTIQVAALLNVWGSVLTADSKIPKFSPQPPPGCPADAPCWDSKSFVFRDDIGVYRLVKVVA
jgi:hypothetical protein